MLWTPHWAETGDVESPSAIRFVPPSFVRAHTLDRELAAPASINEKAPEASDSQLEIIARLSWLEPSYGVCSSEYTDIAKETPNAANDSFGSPSKIL